MATMSDEQRSCLEIPGLDGAPLILRRIPHGRYLMGSSSGLPFAPEGPEHMVEVNEFWMADSPVTIRQYEAVMSRNPSQFHGHPDLPVESVSWIEAIEFCDTLRHRCGVSVRLPSEAEWEYACRAGSTTQYHFGDSPAKLSMYAWFENNSGGHTAPVRLKKPNAWGLFDMIGNVWEWCSDRWHEDYTGAPCDGAPWLASSSHRLRHCVRGGAWDMDAFRCRSSYRSFDWEEIGTNRTGFRIVTDKMIAPAPRSRPIC